MNCEKQTSALHLPITTKELIMGEMKSWPPLSQKCSWKKIRIRLFSISRMVS